MVKKKKIFISCNYRDNAKVNLLKEQLANSAKFDATFVSEGISNSEDIKNAISKQIANSALMLVMLGERWSDWQEYELNTAIKKGVPIVGLLSNKDNIIESTIWTDENIPIVNWNWSEISEILSGEIHSLDYKAPDVKKLESPIIQLDFSAISEKLTAYLLRNPDAMHNMSPRKFEELVAYIMKNMGMK